MLELNSELLVMCRMPRALLACSCQASLDSVRHGSLRVPVAAQSAAMGIPAYQGISLSTLYACALGKLPSGRRYLACRDTCEACAPVCACAADTCC